MQAIIVILINEDMLCICIYEVDPRARKTFMRVSVVQEGNRTIKGDKQQPLSLTEGNHKPRCKTASPNPY